MQLEQADQCDLCVEASGMYQAKSLLVCGNAIRVGHGTYVALEDLSAASGRQCLVAVPPADVCLALRFLEDAYRRAPMTTSIHIVVPLQCGLRQSWRHLLKHYKVIRRVSARLNGELKWFEVLHREHNIRERGLGPHVDPDSTITDHKLCYAVDAPLGYQLRCTFDLRISGQMTRTLADTGASTSVVSRATMEAAGVNMHDVTDTITGVEGAATAVLGACVCVLEISGRSVDVRCLVVETLPGRLQAILGQDLFRPCRMAVLFGQKELEMSMVIDRKRVAVSRPYSSDSTTRPLLDDAPLTKKQLKRAMRSGILRRVFVTLAPEHSPHAPVQTQSDTPIEGYR